MTTPEVARAHDVSHEVAAFHREAAEIGPHVRVTDLDGDLGELRPRLHLGVGAHPVEGPDAVLERGQEVPGHRLDLRLALGREVGLHVGLAHNHSEAAIDFGDGALGERPILLCAREDGAAKRETLIDKGLAEIRGTGGENTEAQVGLPRGERRVVDELAQVFEVTGLAHVHAVDSGGGEALKKRIPVEAWRQRLELRQSRLVVGLDGVAVLHRSPMSGGDGGFEGHDRRGLVTGSGHARKSQHLLDVALILRFGVHQTRIAG